MEIYVTTRSQKWFDNEINAGIKIEEASIARNVESEIKIIHEVMNYLATKKGRSRQL
jgi:hypothetical protein